MIKWWSSSHGASSRGVPYISCTCLSGRPITSLIFKFPHKICLLALPAWHSCHMLSYSCNTRSTLKITFNRWFMQTRVWKAIGLTRFSLIRNKTVPWSKLMKCLPPVWCREAEEAELKSWQVKPRWNWRWSHGGATAELQRRPLGSWKSCLGAERGVNQRIKQCLDDSALRATAGIQLNPSHSLPSTLLCALKHNWRAAIFVISWVERHTYILKSENQECALQEEAAIQIEFIRRDNFQYWSLPLIAEPQILLWLNLRNNNPDHQPLQAVGAHCKFSCAISEPAHDCKLQQSQIRSLIAEIHKHWHSPPPPTHSSTT